MGERLVPLMPVPGGTGYFGGPEVLVFVFLPTMLVAASIGVWLFYVQRQFEETNWDHEADWQLHEAAPHGSSHYVLPGLLRCVGKQLWDEKTRRPVSLAAARTA